MFDEIPEDEYTDLPEPEHVGTMMDAVIDTVAGNEGLTYAQHYAHSVLQTSGSVSSRTGTEGFFADLGDGLKAIWDYIVKMFKAIWGFFFGSEEKSSEAQTTKTKKAIDEAIVAVEVVKEGPKTTAEGNATIKKVETKAINVAKAADSSTDKKKAEEIIERVKEAKDKPPAVQKEAIKKAVVDLSGLGTFEETHKNSQEVYDDMIASLQKETDKVVGDTDWQDSDIGRDFVSFGTSIDHAFTSMRSETNALVPKDIHGVDQAMASLKKLAQSRGLDKNSIGKLVYQYKTKVKKMVDDLEKQVSHDGDKANITKELNAAKSVLVIVINLGKMVTLENLYARNLAGHLGKQFGV